MAPDFNTSSRLILRRTIAPLGTSAAFKPLHPATKATRREILADVEHGPFRIVKIWSNIGLIRKHQLKKAVFCSPSYSDGPVAICGDIFWLWKVSPQSN